jgi:hypothetical protein
MQKTFDLIFFSSSNIMAELISGSPNGGATISFYAVVERRGPAATRLKGGYENSFFKIIVNMSKTYWPIVTKNKDTMNISMNGSSETFRIVSTMHEDAYTYTVGLI